VAGLRDRTGVRLMLSVVPDRAMADVRFRPEADIDQRLNYAAPPSGFGLNELLDAVTCSLRDGRFGEGLEQVRKGNQRRKGTDEHLLRRAAWWEQDRLDFICRIERMFHHHWLNVGINYLLGNAKISPLMRAFVAQLVEKANILVQLLWDHSNAVSQINL